MWNKEFYKSNKIFFKISLRITRSRVKKGRIVYSQLSR